MNKRKKMDCECGKEITEEELNADWNRDYEIKMCTECMEKFAEHGTTGE
jgi:hypothetical protein